MGQTVGKQVERKYSKSLIFEKLRFSDLEEIKFEEDPMKFIVLRFEMKE